MKRFLLALAVSSLPALGLPLWGQAVITPPGPSPTNPSSISNEYLYYNKMHWAGGYDPKGTYNSQDVVISNGAGYVSLQPINLNHNPATSPTWWDPLPVGANWLTLSSAPVFDVRSFGADATGAADSTAAIQSAANAAIAINGTIYLPAGTFKVTSKVSLCSNWNYANVFGSGNGSVLAPTAAFPQTTVDPASAVFNTDCGVGNGHYGTPGGQPNTNVGPSLRDFRITFTQNFSVANRTLLAHWTGLNFNNTENVKAENIIIENGWQGISHKATWGNPGGGNVWEGLVGRSTFTNIGLGTYNLGIDIDGMTDSSRFNAIHIWPYGGVFSNWFYDPANVGWQIGRADDLSINNGLCISGKCMQFIAGADGNSTYTKINGQGFDSFWAIDMQGTGYTGSSQPNVMITNSTISFNPTVGPVSAGNYYTIKYARGNLTMTGGYINCSAYANSPIYIDDTFNGGTASIIFEGVQMFAQNTAGVRFFQQVNDPNTTNLTISLIGDTWFSWPGVTMTVPLIDIQQTGGGSARLEFKGNTLTLLNNSSVGLRVAQDDFHDISGNSWAYVSPTQGWTTSFPATKTSGFYQDSTGALYDVKINGTSPNLLWNDGTTTFRDSYQGGIRYFDLLTNGHYRFRLNDVTNVGDLDYLGNLQVMSSIFAGPTAFAALGVPTLQRFTWCNDCVVATPCAGGGGGAWAFSNGTRWACPF